MVSAESAIFLSLQPRLAVFTAGSWILHAGIQLHRSNTLKRPSADFASRADTLSAGNSFVVSSRRAVPALAKTIWMLSACIANHRRDVTEFASAVFAFVWAGLTTVICDMLSLAEPIRMLGAGIAEQRTQRFVFRAAIDAYVFATFPTLV